MQARLSGSIQVDGTANAEVATEREQGRVLAATLKLRRLLLWPKAERLESTRLHTKWRPPRAVFVWSESKGVLQSGRDVIDHAG